MTRREIVSALMTRRERARRYLRCLYMLRALTEHGGHYGPGTRAFWRSRGTHFRRELDKRIEQTHIALTLYKLEIGRRQREESGS